MNKKIIFSTGGTGGHIFPAVNLMKHFFNNGYKVLLVTDSRGINFMKSYSEFKSYVLNTETPTNKNFLGKISSYIKIFFSIIRAMIILKKEKPNIVFGLGGYVSFPISFASKFYNLPLFIYENNVILGRTNKYLLSLSKKIFLAKKINKSIPKKYEDKIYEVGTILNKKIINYSPSPKKNYHKNFSILILGGSQGAEVFGAIVPPVIKMIKNKGFEIKIIQQCIANQKSKVENFYSLNNIKNYVFEFDKNILELIISSDLAITRSGASTTAELAYTQTPFIAVPLPTSIDDHQKLNAEYYKKEGCCWILEQNNFNEENLFNLIMEILKNKNKLEIIQQNMKKNYKKDVYENIENQIKEFF